MLVGRSPFNDPDVRGTQKSDGQAVGILLVTFGHIGVLALSSWIFASEKVANLRILHIGSFFWILGQDEKPIAHGIGFDKFQDVLWAVGSAMPLGTICQLHYAGGGYVHPDGHVPIGFRGSIHGFQIGQRVTFVVSQGEAVEVQKVQRESVESERPVTMLKTRMLQRSIGRFHNATLEKRLEMLTHAEGLLEQLLAEDELDGDAICRLICKCVGWLHPEVAAEASSGKVPISGKPNWGSVQCRVRRLLIKALSCLDLNDATTCRAVESALAHINRLTTSSVSLKTTRAAKQWQQLKSLVASSIAVAVAVTDDMPKNPGFGERQDLSSEGSQNTFVSGCFPDVSDEKREKRQISGKDRAGMLERAYFPSTKVKQLEHVFSSAESVRLQCPQCMESITSNWYWKHPKTHDVYVLVPSKGHSACNRKAGKRIYWRALDGRRTLLDNFQQLDFCQHQRRRVVCRDCGGSQICCHQRPWYHCAVCKKRPRIRQSQPKNIKKCSTVLGEIHYFRAPNSERTTIQPKSGPFFKKLMEQLEMTTKIHGNWFYTKFRSWPRKPFDTSLLHRFRPRKVKSWPWRSVDEWPIQWCGGWVEWNLTGQRWLVWLFEC